jgi:hypothetical protein
MIRARPIGQSDNDDVVIYDCQVERDEISLHEALI